MPPKTLFDITGIDLDHILYNQEVIREVNPQRGAMEHLNFIAWTDPVANRIIGVKNVAEDEFWVEGHIPGRPLMPGVIMIEAAAQLASFYTKKIVGWPGFIGFGGVDEVKFRMQVPPGVRMYLLCEVIWTRHKRVCCKVQGLVQGNVAFEALVFGSQM